jgi:hypothetical protein
MHSNFRRLMAVRLQLGIVRCWDKCEVLRGPPYCPHMALAYARACGIPPASRGANAAALLRACADIRDGDDERLWR